MVGDHVRRGGCCEGVPVPEADGDRVGLLGAHQPRDKQVLLVPRPGLLEINTRAVVKGPR